MSEDTLPSFLRDRVRVVVNDITRQRVDAVVNAANSTLLGGGGVDGAIHRAGGAAILEECQQLRRIRYPKGLPTGEVALTTGGHLAASCVIHTVGPVWGRHEGKEAGLLAACYKNSLALAVEQGLASIAFPSISTGAYSYPRAEAAAVSSQAIKDFLDGDVSLREVRLVFFSTGDAKAFLKHHKFNSGANDEREV